MKLQAPVLTVLAGTGALVAAVDTGVQSACSQLRASFPDNVLMPNSTRYDAERTNVWDIRSNSKPACIFLPTTADAVAQGVTIFHREKTQFAIRGGGHMNVSSSPFPPSRLL